MNIKKFTFLTSEKYSLLSRNEKTKKQNGFSILQEVLKNYLLLKEGDIDRQIEKNNQCELFLPCLIFYHKVRYKS